MSLWSRIQRQIGEIAGDLLPDDARLELDSARELLATDPARARTIAEGVLAARPEHAGAHVVLGTALLELGESGAAADAFDGALRSDADLPVALLGRAEAALALGRPEEAVAPYHRAIEVCGGNRRVLADAYRGLGVAFSRTNQGDKAIRELRKAVAENSDDPVARAALGDALIASGGTEEARRHLRRAADAEHVPALAYLALGKLALHEGDLDIARGAFEAGLEARSEGAFEPAAADLHVGLGDAARMAGQLDAALEHYRRARESGRGDGALAAELLARIAEVHAEAGDDAAALDGYRRSLEARETAEVLERAVDVALRSGSREHKVELADRLLAVVPDHPRALIAKAMAMAEGGNETAARVILAEAASHSAEPLALCALAELDAAAGALERAADRALGALRLAPRSARARALLADVRQRQLRGQMAQPAGAGPAARPKHVKDSADSALYMLALELSSVLGTRAELAALAAEASAAAADFDRPLLVTVMGEFSSGKSSFVNAFIGEDIAPMGITPTTATINVVKYGRHRGGRLLYLDGRAEAISGEELPARLRELSGRAAAQIAQVEILLPLEALERVHIVDTPGLNSIIPEHETVARDFIRRADAVVWVFSAAQAGKKSERLALETITEEGRRVLGVLNKVDQLSAQDAAAVCSHVRDELGELVDVVVPVSARRALEAKARGGGPGDDFARLERELEARFFTQARVLKRRALDRRLAAVLATARGRLRRRRQAGDEQARILRSAAAAVQGELADVLDGTVDRERAAIQAEVRELYRSAAREVLELVRPRRLPFGSHQASPADRDYLVGLLEAGYDAVLGAAEKRVADELGAIGSRARAAVADGGGGSVGDPSGDIDRAVGDATRWVRAQVFGRTSAFLHGYLRGGFVATFFSRDLPKMDLSEETIFQALYNGSPDLDSVIAVPLARACTGALTSLAERLEHLAEVADLRGFDLDVGISSAIERLDEARRALGTSSELPSAELPSAEPPSDHAPASDPGDPAEP